MADKALEEEVQRHSAWTVRAATEVDRPKEQVIVCQGCGADLSGPVSQDDAIRVGPAASREHVDRIREVWARNHPGDLDILEVRPVDPQGDGFRLLPELGSAEQELAIIELKASGYSEEEVAGHSPYTHLLKGTGKRIEPGLFAQGDWYLARLGTTQEL